MKEKHFVGEDLYASFEVTVKGKPARVYSTGVQVFCPDGKLLVEDTCEKTANRVSYKLNRGHVRIPGEYVFIFTVGLKRIGRKQHVVREKVANLPVREKIQRRALPEEKTYATVN